MEPPAARRWLLSGRVQGVGFRPFVYNLARALGVNGWVRNEVGQVVIHGEGDAARLDRFERALLDQAPPLARPAVRERAAAAPIGATGFAILPSLAGAVARIHVPPDSFACDDCVREMRDPADRRFAYPFINCTQCGPRYTILRALPYDRPNTTMAGFPLCAACRAEYDDPGDRRFHAQPVACPDCGPRVSFVPGAAAPERGSDARVPSEPCGASLTGDAAVDAAVAALRAGRVLAVKGIGGYHLVCDAADEAAVRRLRARKPRPDKPLAVMFSDLAALERTAAPGEVHRTALLDPMRPIVLTPLRQDGPLAAAIAPGLREVGAFLPYSPLHHLLLDRFGGSLVATSANGSGEPVLTDNAEVERRLGRVAEAYLHHDRPIARPADDPVYRVIAGVPRVVRLGRGCAPAERSFPWTFDRPVLAVGGHMKNTVALGWDDRVVVSPHVGDLEAPRSRDVFARTVADLQDLYRVRAEAVIHDAHPRYASTRWALASGLPFVPVLHHHAHASGLAGEYPEERDWIVFAWDAVGYGEHGALWGGEGFVGRPGAWRRRATIRRFRLPGGERAGREPWRSALGACWEADLVWDHAPADTALVREAWRRGLNAPETTGVGRLFDAAAAILELCVVASFEGQGPMLVEAAADEGAEPWSAPSAPDADGVLTWDWAPAIAGLLDGSASTARRAARFHATLAEALCAQAHALRDETGIAAVGLTGGVFQNRLLAERAIERLTEAGFRVYLPREIPANDGGLAFGQLMEYAGRVGARRTD